MTGKRAYNPSLDGIRGVAALAVFFHHAVFTAIDPTEWPAPYRPLIVASHAGQYGLDLFFVLSGYLITTILLEKKDSPRYFRDFYVNRATRILPIYALVLLTVLLLVPGVAGYVVLSALFVANFAPVFQVTAIGPFWTLAIEEQFYAVWPWLVRYCSVRRLLQVAVAIALAEPVFRLADIAIHHDNFKFTFFHADGLALGAVLACRGGRATPGGIATTLAAGIVLYGLSLAGFANPFVRALFEALQLSAVSMIAYGVIATLVARELSWPARWLANPVLMFFGRISYCLYLIHLYVLMGFDDLFGRPAGLQPIYLLTRMLVVLAVAVALSALSRRYIELPALRLRRRFA